jgi:chemotaxis protein MotA
MDGATLIGLSLAFAMITTSIAMGGGNVRSFWDGTSLLVVLGGTIGAVLVCFPLRTVFRMPRIVTKTMFHEPPDYRQLIQQIVSLAVVARRDGLLALEPKLTTISDPFVRQGMQMAIDGTRAEVIEDVLRTEIEAMAVRHKEGKGLLDQLGRYAPAFGMIGTLLGLIIMLGNMSDPSTIGSGMAVALTTTLYGAVLSYASFLPMAEKLAYFSKQEVVARELALRGILAIQSGENPRIIEQKLSTFLPPPARASREGART